MSLSSALIIAIILPPATFYYGCGSSMAGGVLSFSLLIMLLHLIGARSVPRRVVVAPIVAALISLHFIVSLFLVQVDVERFFLSICLMVLLLSSASIFAGTWAIADDEVVSRGVNWCLVLLFGMLVLSVVGIQPPSCREFEKSIFPFTEPSHFALVFIPLFMYFCLQLGRRMRLAALVAMPIVGLSVENMTIMVGWVLVAMVVIGARSVFLLIPFSFVLVFLGFDVEYYTNRLEFSGSENLSVLVYIQGWEMLQASLLSSDGWGGGFQQLGVFGSGVSTSGIIESLAGRHMNLLDGGFLAAKIIGEFGVFGVLMVLVYVYVFVCAFAMLRSDRGLSSAEKLACCFVLSASVELFVRGIGYFSITNYILISSIFFLFRGWSVLSLRLI